MTKKSIKPESESSEHSLASRRAWMETKGVVDNPDEKQWSR
jgi:hypothetical protein